jgi:hypothetical protein
MVGLFILDASVAAARCFADEATTAGLGSRRILVDRTAVVPRPWHTEPADKWISPEEIA